eukprot:15059613-Alexandrium_andersonii.AAC.1
MSPGPFSSLLGAVRWQPHCLDRGLGIKRDGQRSCPNALLRHARGIRAPDARGPLSPPTPGCAHLHVIAANPSSAPCPGQPAIEPRGLDLPAHPP